MSFSLLISQVYGAAWEVNNLRDFQFQSKFVFVDVKNSMLPNPKENFIRAQIFNSSVSSIQEAFTKLWFLELGPPVVKHVLITCLTHVYICLSFQSFILPNQPINERTPLHMFHVPVETIERASGLIFFDKVPRHTIMQIRPTIASSN